MSSPRHVELVVPPEASGDRLDRFVAARVPEISRSRLAKWIDSGAVLVDGEPAKVSLRLRGGELVSLDVPEPDDGGLVPEARELSILHEDAEILVIDKPAGLIVHPGAGATEGTLAHALLHHCGPSLRSVGGPGRPGLVHRLDKGTSGVMVIAKTPVAHLELTAQFAARSVAKTYVALVLGSPLPSGRVDAPIGRSAATRTRMAIVAGGRPAVSEWRVAERFGHSLTWIEIDLHTGRTHQARVHMMHAGHPIAGDATYRGNVTPEAWTRPFVSSLHRPALHAHRLAFEHPATGERLEFEAPLAPDLASLLDALRARLAGSVPMSD